MKSFLLILFISLSFSLFSLNAIAETVNKNEIRKRPDDFSSFAYAVDPTYKIDNKDIEAAKSNPNTKFALGLGLNSTFNITPELKSFLKTNPNTLFSYSLSQNSNYKIDTSDKKYIEENPNTLYAFGLTRNPNYSYEKQTKDKNNKTGRFEDGSRFLFTYNIKNWIKSASPSAFKSIESPYNMITGILILPIDFLSDNFNLFDFLHLPVSKWTGWSIFHAIILLGFLSSVFMPRNRPVK